MTRPLERTVQTSLGPAKLHYNRPRRTLAVLVLGHGAGGGPHAPDLLALSTRMEAADIAVIRVEQPWRVAGKPIAPAPATLDRAWLEVCDQLRTRKPRILGGRSAGARVACRTADRLGAAGCLALAFPLHPPGKPEASRADELSGVTCPTLVVQGERDTFGTPTELPADRLPTGSAVVSIPAADHGFKVPKRAEVTAEAALGMICEAVGHWVYRLVGAGNRTG